MPRITDYAWGAQLHKETYTAIVNSALRTPGQKQGFAKQVGITPQYLSNLLDPDDTRTPGQAIAKKMADALPLDPEERARAYEHFQLSRQRRVDHANAQRVDSSTPPPDTRVVMLGQDHLLATISTETHMSRPRFIAVRDTAKDLLLQIDPFVAPLSIVRICFILHDTLCLLNCPDDALYYARLAHWLLQSLDDSAHHKQREYLDWLEFHAIRAESVAYYALKLHKEAGACCKEAGDARAVHQRPDKCKPHVLRDKLNILSSTMRFSLYVAEELAQEVTRLCQRHARLDDPMWDFLMQRSLGRAYHAYGNTTKARRIFETLLGQMPVIPKLGPVSQAVFLNSYAAMLLERGQKDEWEDILKRATSVEASAHLTPEFVKMRQSYGPTMGPLLSELKIIPTDSGADAEETT